MARIETRDDDPQIPPAPVGPPRGDEGLDDWFTRRLEAQGIAARGNGFPTARVLSVVALIVAVGALLWVIHSASGSSSSSSGSSNPTTTPQTQGSTGSTGPSSTGTTGGGPTTYQWNDVKVTVINGNGQTGAAGDAQTTLNQAGWNVVAATNSVGGATVDATEVVYPPGKKGPATAVATKLGLTPVKAADAGAAIPPDLQTVAIVLGPDGLPTTT
jgi:hypothetical protein